LRILSGCAQIDALLSRTHGHSNMAHVRDISAREFAAADTDGNGVLTIDEFLVASRNTPMLAKYFHTLDKLCSTL
jgi:hypothetical protein